MTNLIIEEQEYSTGRRLRESIVETIGRAFGYEVKFAPKPINLEEDYKIERSNN
jgi:hypothetical protein